MFGIDWLAEILHLRKPPEEKVAELIEELKLLSAGFEKMVLRRAEDSPLEAAAIETKNSVLEHGNKAIFNLAQSLEIWEKPPNIAMKQLMEESAKSLRKVVGSLEELGRKNLAMEDPEDKAFTRRDLFSRNGISDHLGWRRTVDQARDLTSLLEHQSKKDIFNWFVKFITAGYDDFTKEIDGINNQLFSGRQSLTPKW